MKYTILIVILITRLFSSDNYELKLYQKLLPDIFQKKHLIIYPLDHEQINILQDSSIFKISDNCSDSDLIIGKKFYNLPQECYDKPMFATSYRSYKHTKNVFGAFYWRKGRPQVHFKLEVIKKYNLHLSNSLKRYAK